MVVVVGGDGDGGDDDDDDEDNEAVDLRSTQSTPDWKDRDGPQDLLRRRSP